MKYDTVQKFGIYVLYEILLKTQVSVNYAKTIIAIPFLLAASSHVTQSYQWDRRDNRLRASRKVSLQRQKIGTYDILTLELVIEDKMLEAATNNLLTKTQENL